MTIQTKYLLIIPLALLIACTPTQEDEKTEMIFDPDARHLLVMHPTVQNLDRMNVLRDEGIFPLGDDYRIIGVYHTDANYDYERSADYILDEGFNDMALYAVDQPIYEDSLYMENKITETFHDLFRQSEGVFFLGGPDLPPATYGEPFNLLTVVSDPVRHYLELSFLFHLIGGSHDLTMEPLLAENEDYVVLGICLGMQTINVAAGGTLHQDIPTEVYDVHTVEEVIALDNDKQHRNYYSYYRLDPDVSTPNYHRIDIDAHSHMAVIAGDMGQQPYVLSSHHQAIKETGHNLKETAWSLDGEIPEALEHISYPHVLGVQFHPEVPYLYDPDHKLTFRPGEEATHSYMELYPGTEGEDFHRDFWVHIAAMLP